MGASALARAPYPTWRRNKQTPKLTLQADHNKKREV
jgi:hypothetical protein